MRRKSDIDERGQTILRLEASIRTRNEKITALEKVYLLWRSRALDVRARFEMLREQNERLLADNEALAQKLVELAMRPQEKVDVTGILDQFRRTIQPDIIPINNGADGKDEQRRGIDWTAQGLDNNAGVPDTFNPDANPASIPDYVLDIESLDPDALKGTRGGWYNPTQTPTPRPNG